jgi:F0F1-type ATP synthase membrane subunit b/b'
MIAFFRSHMGPFRARSPERDKETDSMNVARVTRTIEQAIASCEAERDGLGRRLADVTVRAAIFAGNGSDDYLERESAVSDRLKVLDDEVKNAQRRLDQLAHNIAQFEQLREDLNSRFPELVASADPLRDPAGYGAQQTAAAR